MAERVLRAWQRPGVRAHLLAILRFGSPFLLFHGLTVVFGDRVISLWEWGVVALLVIGAGLFGRKLHEVEWRHGAWSRDYPPVTPEPDAETRGRRVKPRAASSTILQP